MEASKLDSWKLNSISLRIRTTTSRLRAVKGLPHVNMSRKRQARLVFFFLLGPWLLKSIVSITRVDPSFRHIYRYGMSSGSVIKGTTGRGMRRGEELAEGIMGKCGWKDAGSQTDKQE